MRHALGRPWDRRSPASCQAVAGLSLDGMCGRYAQARAEDDLVDAFDVKVAVGAALAPSWNVAPGREVRVVVERTADRQVVRQLRTMRWGLVPSWADDPHTGRRMINARAESITDKPAFRAATARRRAIVPMDGYFEWEPTPDGKRPWYLTGDGGAPLAAAGLYELWADPSRGADADDRWLWSLAIVTTRTADELGHVHDRAPLLLPRELWARWLDPGLTEAREVADLVSTVPEPHLRPRRVGPEVGSVRNDGPGLVLAVA